MADCLRKKIITMSILMEFAMFPTDKGTSVSKYVAEVIEMIKKSGANYKLTAMGTIIETDKMEEALELINEAYKILKPHSKRIYSTVKFDIREDGDNRLENKLKSVESKIGSVNK